MNSFVGRYVGLLAYPFNAERRIKTSRSEPFKN
jgi:hypothetical protein